MVHRSRLIELVELFFLSGVISMLQLDILCESDNDVSY
jgi:hypothetical protein